MLLKRVIPQKISNKTVWKAMEWMRRHTNHIPEAVIAQNYAENIKQLQNTAVLDPAGFIENQAQWGAVRFGSGKNHTMRYSGCEIIATFNALTALGERADAARMAELIRHYEGDGAMRNGEFGVSPGAIRDFFLEKKWEVRVTDAKDGEQLDAFGSENDVLIATAYNDKNDIMAQVHTVCVTKNESGGYVVHNAYCRSKKGYVQKDNGGKGYAGLWDAIAAIHEAAAPISVIGLKKRR